MVIVHSGPYERDMVVRPEPVSRSHDECYDQANFDLDEVYMYVAKRTRTDLDKENRRRKIVLQPGWVKACINAGRLLDEDHMGGYEIR